MDILHAYNGSLFKDLQSTSLRVANLQGRALRGENVTNELQKESTKINLTASALETTRKGMIAKNQRIDKVGTIISS